jgi:D-glycero-alpha-D-manno-heptose-7-phosphate kinase
MRTQVRLQCHDPGRIRISSKGFQSVEYPLGSAPFDQPLGLMLAIATYFDLGGVHIDIQSSSPPRSGLGGSSVAAVALIGAYCKVLEIQGQPLWSPRHTALLAHEIESSMAGVPCGCQDQLAAAYGGVNAWYWNADPAKTRFKRQPLLQKDAMERLPNHMLLAYCGVPHESKNVNAQWVAQFTSGLNRDKWAQIIHCTHAFITAITEERYDHAAELMNRETLIRREMTPDVLDEVGVKLVAAAEDGGCGARFTGAGGGGCIWALGSTDKIDRLKQTWENVLSAHPSACLLPVEIDCSGMVMQVIWK